MQKFIFADNCKKDVVIVSFMVSWNVQILPSIFPWSQVRLHLYKQCLVGRGGRGHFKKFRQGYFFEFEIEQIVMFMGLLKMTVIFGS